MKELNIKMLFGMDILLKYLGEVEDFFDKLFVFPELKNYMYEHLASTLQSFQIKIVVNFIIIN